MAATTRTASRSLAGTRFRSMDADVTLSIASPGPRAEEAIAVARRVFEAVEASCSRFDPNSDLVRANTTPHEWHQVAPECLVSIAEAARAHRETDGLFDPRVLRTLVALGYDRTLGFRTTDVVRPAPTALPGTAPRGRWRPDLDEGRCAVRLGPHPIDLGGIGKGLAVRWAAAELADAGEAYLVEAGGDCYLGGAGPEGDGWRVGAEDPFGGGEPVAVLRLVNRACATSSRRVRSWRSGDREVHHLIDPRTGDSARSGLRAVTVVGADPARAEVWSKALLIGGVARIGQVCRAHGLAAIWVDDDGRLGVSPAMAPHLLWRASDEG